MKKLLEFRIPGLPPSTNKLYKISKLRKKKRVLFQSKESINFKRKMVLMFSKKPRIDVPIALLLEFHIRTNLKYNKRDLDNYLKCTIDGLQLAGQIRNDNQVIFCATMKLRATQNFVRGYIYEMPKADSLFEVFHSLMLDKSNSQV